MSSPQAQFELQHGPFDDVDLEKAFSEMTFEEMDEWLKKDNRVPFKFRPNRSEFEQMKLRARQSWDLKYVVADKWEETE